MKVMMTYFPQRKCWSKFYKGKRYYCPIKCEKDDMSSYTRSWKWWQNKKRSIDGDDIVINNYQARRLVEGKTIRIGGLNIRLGG